MLFEKEMEERSENSCESSRTRTAIGSGYVHRHRPTALVRHVAGMLCPGAQGDQGRPDDCAAIRITHIGAKNDELKTGVAHALTAIHFAEEFDEQEDCRL